MSDSKVKVCTEDKRAKTIKGKAKPESAVKKAAKAKVKKVKKVKTVKKNTIAVKNGLTAHHSTGTSSSNSGSSKAGTGGNSGASNSNKSKNSSVSSKVSTNNNTSSVKNTNKKVQPSKGIAKTKARNKARKAKEKQNKLMLNQHQSTTHEQQNEQVDRFILYGNNTENHLTKAQQKAMKKTRRLEKNNGTTPDYIKQQQEQSKLFSKKQLKQQEIQKEDQSKQRSKEKGSDEDGESGIQNKENIQTITKTVNQQLEAEIMKATVDLGDLTVIYDDNINYKKKLQQRMILNLILIFMLVIFSVVSSYALIKYEVSLNFKYAYQVTSVMAWIMLIVIAGIDLIQKITQSNKSTPEIDFMDTVLKSRSAKVGYFEDDVLIKLKFNSSFDTYTLTHVLKEIGLDYDIQDEGVNRYEGIKLTIDISNRSKVIAKIESK